MNRDGDHERILDPAFFGAFFLLNNTTIPRLYATSKHVE